VVEYVMVNNPEFVHTVCASVPGADVNVIVLSGVTVILPVAVITPQPPVSVIKYVLVPDTVGVPLIVSTLFDHELVTPVGSGVTVAPVAPVVLYVILVIAVLIHIVCELVPTAELNVIVLFGLTNIVPVAVAGAQPPVVVTV
jgi:hypothetical protein